MDIKCDKVEAASGNALLAISNSALMWHDMIANLGLPVFTSMASAFVLGFIRGQWNEHLQNV